MENKTVLTPQGKRNYFKILIGLKKWSYVAKRLNKHVGFLTLTSSIIATNGLNDSERIDMLHRNFQLLRLRLKRDHGLSIDEYFKVTTTEGNGVIHIVYTGDFIPHETIVEEWNEVHASQIVFIEEQKLDTDSQKQQSCYLMSQYLSSQNNCVSRFGITQNWVYPGFLKDWHLIKCRNREYLGSLNQWGYETYSLNIDNAKFQFGVLLSKRFDMPMPLKPPDFKTDSLNPILNVVDKQVYEYQLPKKHEKIPSFDWDFKQSFLDDNKFSFENCVHFKTVCERCGMEFSSSNDLYEIRRIVSLEKMIFKFTLECSDCLKIPTAG